MNVAPVLPVVAAQTVNEIALLTVNNTATELPTRILHWDIPLIRCAG